MVLGEIFPRETIVVNLESTEKDELFEELVESIHKFCPNLDRVAAVEALNERESKMSTGIMHSVAVPHALVSSMKKTVGAIGVSKSGIDYDALDKAPVHVVFMILGADGETEKHIQILKQLALVLQNPGIVDKIVRCETASDVFNLISKTEESLSE
ncbi:MAG: PTS sugar transporter subunit IIA [Treponema sp.]|nr:PTS sugar transporter subunit IIA [Treponema sp.]MBR4629415.1 PTS sugar transporter subunit IIA [Treponema sp.]MCR5123646.1 PTS sugar transporter subunit IIA [Treponema sp.]